MGKTRNVCNIVVKIDQLNLIYWIAFPASQTMWRRSVGWLTNRKRWRKKIWRSWDRASLMCSF